jgi:ribosome-associated protein
VTELKPSKSARKREYIALQRLGEELLTVKEPDLLRMQLDEELLDAVLEARRIKAHGALRRQKQYIGKLMRNIDPEPIRAALAQLRR